jgi:uncharacterized membrane protein
MTTAVAAAAAPNRALIGISCMLLASSLFPVMNGLVQILSERYTTEQVVWARAASHLVFILALFAPRFGVPLVRTAALKWQIVRSSVHLASMLFFFTGVKYLPLAKAASISFTAPFFVALLAWPLLGERITPTRLTAEPISSRSKRDQSMSQALRSLDISTTTDSNRSSLPCRRGHRLSGPAWATFI